MTSQQTVSNISGNQFGRGAVLNVKVGTSAKVAKDTNAQECNTRASIYVEQQAAAGLSDKYLKIFETAFLAIKTSIHDGKWDEMPAEEAMYEFACEAAKNGEEEDDAFDEKFFNWVEPRVAAEFALYEEREGSSKKAALEIWLKEKRLSRIFASLVDLGAEDTTDLLDLDDEDIAGLQLKKLEMKRFRRAIDELKS